MKLRRSAGIVDRLQDGSRGRADVVWCRLVRRTDLRPPPDLDPLSRSSRNTPCETPRSPEQVIRNNAICSIGGTGSGFRADERTGRSRRDQSPAPNTIADRLRPAPNQSRDWRQTGTDEQDRRERRQDRKDLGHEPPRAITITGSRSLGSVTLTPASSSCRRKASQVTC